MSSLRGARRVLHAASCALVLAAGCRSAAPRPTGTPTPSLSHVHVGGRVLREGNALLHTWPGVYFEASFRGSSLGIALSDPDGIYNVEIDGMPHSSIAAPGDTTHWISGLPPGHHSVRLSIRTESIAKVPRFLGFVPGPDGALLERPPRRRRQIEFLGDSLTTGYGVHSETRECTPAELQQRSDVDRTFAVLTARHYDMDYQINAKSGFGIVRNWNGTLPATNFPAIYSRVLRNVEGSGWTVPGDWRPRLVVIGLGGNDYNTPIQPGEPWTNESLLVEFKKRYHDLIARVRARYGPETTFLLGSMDLPHAATLLPAVQAVVDEENKAGHARVYHHQLDTLEFTACHGHPSLLEHQRLSRGLIAWMEAHPELW